VDDDYLIRASYGSAGISKIDTNSRTISPNSSRVHKSGNCNHFTTHD
jgi:hypothetical protein